MWRWSRIKVLTSDKPKLRMANDIQGRLEDIGGVVGSKEWIAKDCVLSKLLQRPS